MEESFMKNNVTLVIMAAGMGSRFGGLKQIEPVGMSGEFIIDYSIYDAKRVGFNKVVFIIKEENYDLFKDTVGKRIEKYIDVEYVFQSNDLLPEEIKQNRVKPLGTAHAILCVKNVVKENFAVINADDFYGYDAFKVVKEFLDNNTNNEYALVAYNVINTITYKDISSDGKIYLPNTVIDELNITLEIDQEDWTLVNDVIKDLFTERCFDFNIDDNGYPYLQLNNDYTNIDTNAVIVLTYYSTLGNNGMISVNTINTSLLPIKDTSGNLVTSSLGNSVSVNGYDPETVIEAYYNSIRYINQMNSIITTDDLTNAVMTVNLSIPVSIANALSIDNTDTDCYVTPIYDSIDDTLVIGYNFLEYTTVDDIPTSDIGVILYSVDNTFYEWNSTQYEVMTEQPTNIPENEAICLLAIYPKPETLDPLVVTNLDNELNDYNMVNVRVNYNLTTYQDIDFEFDVYTYDINKYLNNSFVGYDIIDATTIQSPSDSLYYYEYSTNKFYQYNSGTSSFDEVLLTSESSKLYLSITNLLLDELLPGNSSYGEIVRIIDIVRNITDNISDIKYVDLPNNSPINITTNKFKLPKLGLLKVNIN
jgi:hypothetical protein